MESSRLSRVSNLVSRALNPARSQQTLRSRRRCQQVFTPLRHPGLLCRRARPRGLKGQGALKGVPAPHTPLGCQANLQRYRDTCLCPATSQVLPSPNNIGKLLPIVVHKKIRTFLTRQALTQVIIALVTSRKDYANSLYLGLSKILLRRLQSIQNQAARLIHYLPKYGHISKVMKDLHWLPIAQRTMFKVCCTVFKALYLNCPAFMKLRISKYCPTRQLRCSHLHYLVVPSCKKQWTGGRRFSVIAPQIWNTLPLDMRSTLNYTRFKQLLKTWLFKQAYQ